MPKKSPRSRKVNKDESTIICKKYAENQGKWDKILIDPEIKIILTELSEKTIKAHLNYKKKMLTKLQNPKQHDKGIHWIDAIVTILGTNKRKRILDAVAEKSPAEIILDISGR